ncbi:MAG: hypothetical protein JWO08_540 [Verrucomicrobiaceae bacterium]|nr:hypothetical protein [Verrucomicrobiaceae bacterium]
MADQRYKIYEQLGAGGNGAVYRAYDTQLKRWVAIKRLISASEISEGDPSVDELRREADTLASLRNANIVTIFDVSSDAEGLFIVMELLEGPDLADATQHGPLSLEDFKQLAEQTLEALLAAHQLRILHRDLKPENIKVERLPGGRFQAKIIDFGLARAGLGARKQTEDQAGSVMGSIYYMAPEQLSREPTDVRTDIYSLGCVFYEALAARKAFDGKSVSEVIDKHLDHDVVPLNTLCPHLPQWLTYWVMRLMACKPDDRPASAQQAIEEYRAWEKLPPAPHMMTWMPMNYGYGYGHHPQQAAPQYGTATAPLYQPGSGPVPLHTTGYYAPPHITSSSVPVHPQAVPQGQVPYAQPVRPSTAVPVKPVAASNTKWFVIGGVGAVVAIGAFLMLKGGGKSTKTNGAPAPVAPASGIEVGPARENMFPGDRAYPPPDKMRVVHFIARTATRGYNGKSVPGKNDSNSPVSVWDDLTQRGDNTPLVTVGTNPDVSPQRVKWANVEGLIKPDRYALDFTSKVGKTVTMRLYQPEKHKDSFPFGVATPPFPAGLTLGLAFQPGGQLPCRVARLSSPDGEGSVTLRVMGNKTIEADFQSGADSKKLVSSNIDATRPCIAILTWSSENNEVQLRTRDARGFTHKVTATLGVPQGALYDLDLGGVVDTPDQFNGQIAECAVFATAMREDQVSLWDKDLRDQYFVSGPSKALKDRLLTKLPLIDNAAKAWKLTASITKENPAQAADGNVGTRWSTGGPMTSGTWFQIELPKEADISGVALDSPFPNDYPHGYKVDVSMDGRAWATAAEGEGKTTPTEIVFSGAKKARFIRINQTSNSPNFWSIDEVLLFRPK